MTILINRQTLLVTGGGAGYANRETPIRPQPTKCIDVTMRKKSA